MHFFLIVLGFYSQQFVVVGSLQQKQISRFHLQQNIFMNKKKFMEKLSREIK